MLPAFSWKNSTVGPRSGAAAPSPPGLHSQACSRTPSAVCSHSSSERRPKRFGSNWYTSRGAPGSAGTYTNLRCGTQQMRASAPLQLRVCAGVRA